MPSRKSPADPESDACRIGRTLRRLRERRRLFLRQVAERMGKPASCIPLIARWERGITSARGDENGKSPRATASPYQEHDRELQAPSKKSRSPALVRIAREMEMLSRPVGQSTRRNRGRSIAGR